MQLATCMPPFTTTAYAICKTEHESSAVIGGSSISPDPLFEDIGPWFSKALHCLDSPELVVPMSYSLIIVSGITYMKFAKF